MPVDDMFNNHDIEHIYDCKSDIQAAVDKTDVARQLAECQWCALGRLISCIDGDEGKMVVHIHVFSPITLAEDSTINRYVQNAHTFGFNLIGDNPFTIGHHKDGNVSISFNQFKTHKELLDSRVWVHSTNYYYCDKLWVNRASYDCAAYRVLVPHTGPKCDDSMIKTLKSAGFKTLEDKILEVNKLEKLSHTLIHKNSILKPDMKNKNDIYVD